MKSNTKEIPIAYLLIWGFFPPTVQFTFFFFFTRVVEGRGVWKEREQGRRFQIFLSVVRFILSALEQCTSTQMCSLTIAYSNEQGLLTMNTSDRKFQLPAVLVYLSANFLISFADKATLLCVHENKGSCT